MAKKKNNKIIKNSAIKESPQEPLSDSKSDENAYIEKQLIQPIPENPVKTKNSRILKYVLRTLFFAFAVLILALVIGYNIIFRPAFFEAFVKKQFTSFTTGSIDLKVEQSSLLRGFIFEKVVVKSGPDFNNEVIFSADSVRVLYDVYGFWTGKFGIHEFSLISPRINLVQRNNIWNVAALAKPSDKVKEPEKPKKKKDKTESEPSDLSFFFNIRLFARIMIENLAVNIDADHKSNKERMRASLENFTFRFHFLTDNFSGIPADPVKFLDKIDTLLVQLNPQRTIKVMLENERLSMKTPLFMHLLLSYDGNNEVPEFYSRMNIGYENIAIRFKSRQLPPLSFSADYSLGYDPVKDSLTIQSFSVSFLRDIWLNLAGNAVSLRNEETRGINFTLDKSEINLTRLLPYFTQLTGNRSMSFGGSASLAPFKVEGKKQEMQAGGKITLRKIFFRKGKLAVSIPDFFIAPEVALNLGDKQKPLREAKVMLGGGLNGSRIKGDIAYMPEAKTHVGFSITSFNPSAFTDNMVNGPFNVNIKVQGPSEYNLSVKLGLYSPGFYYVLDRGKSGVNKLETDIETSIVALDKKFKNIKITIPRIDFTLKNQKNDEGVALRSNSDISQSPNLTTVNYNLKKLSVNVPALMPALTGKLQDSLEVLAKNFKKDIILSGNTGVRKAGTSLGITNSTGIQIPDYDIQDLTLKADTGMSPGLIEIHGVSLKGLNNSLDLSVNGKLKEGYKKDKETGKSTSEKAMIPYIDLRLLFAQKVRKNIFQQNAIEGSLDLQTNVNDSMIEGALKIKDFFFSSPTSRINRVNMDFPFKHDLNFRKALNLKAANKERLIKNYNFSRPFNFTVDSIDVMPHPYLKKVPEMKLIYPQGKYPGLGAFMEYKDNVFTMNTMQIFMLNGLITMQDVIFNLGRGEKSEMEYVAGIQIKDLDFKQLLDEERAKTIQDGAIRTDIFVAGGRLDQPVENLNGFVSIYKIGDEFGKQMLKVVNPNTGGITGFLVDNSIIVKKIDLDLKEGLVYAKVILERKLIGNIAHPSGDKIIQERIPIPEFMQRVNTEVEVYTAPIPEKPKPAAKK